MKVMYLTINPNLASTTMPTDGWYELLTGRGLDPVLVTSEFGGFSKKIQSLGWPCYKESMVPPSWGKGLWNFKSVLRLIQIARKHKVQLIHCNEQNTYPIGAYVAKLLKLPIVVSIHFTIDRGFCKWAFGKHTPDKILFVSEANMINCEPGFLGVVDRDKWMVLNNGLDTVVNKPNSDCRQLFRSEHGLKGSIALGVACALRPRKQVDHFLKAAAEVSGDTRIVVAGGPVKGDEDYAKQLIEKGKELLGDRLIYLGHQSDLSGFYNGIDLFVNTSQEEACSISVLEAMAHELPVIGYPSKSVDCQVLPDGGEIVLQDDLIGLADCLQRWVDNRELRLQFGKSARHRVEQFFDRSINSEMIWDVYNSLL